MLLASALTKVNGGMAITGKNQRWAWGVEAVPPSGPTSQERLRVPDLSALKPRVAK